MLSLQERVLLLTRMSEKCIVAGSAQSTNRKGWKRHKVTCSFICNPPALTLGDYTEPVVVLVTFRKRIYFETLFRDLLNELIARSKYIEATSPERLADILVEEKPTAILISDDTIMAEKY